MYSNRSPPTMSDSELIDRIRNAKAADDRAAYDAAWNILYSRWSPKLRNHYYRFGFTREEADELACSVLVKACFSLSSLKRRDSFSVWIFSIHRHVGCGHIRRKLRDPHPCDVDTEEQLCPKPSPHDHLEEAQLRDRLFKDLSLEEHALLSLLIDGAKPADIIRETGKTPNSVYSRIRRLRKKVKERLHDFGIGIKTAGVTR